MKDEMKKEIALYQTEYDSVIILKVNDWNEDNLDMVRITQPMNVQFTPRKQDEIVPAQIKVLEEKIKKTRAESEAQVTNLKRRIGELLALPPATS